MCSMSLGDAGALNSTHSLTHSLWEMLMYIKLGLLAVVVKYT